MYLPGKLKNLDNKPFAAWYLLPYVKNISNACMVRKQPEEFFSSREILL